MRTFIQSNEAFVALRDMLERILSVCSQCGRGATQSEPESSSVGHRRSENKSQDKPREGESRRKIKQEEKRGGGC